MHHMLMGDVAVSEHDFIDGMSAAQSLELRLFEDRDAARVKPPGKGRRIAATIDIGNLSCRESDDFNGRIIGSECGKDAWALARQYFAGTAGS